MQIHAHMEEATSSQLLCCVAVFTIESTIGKPVSWMTNAFDWSFELVRQSVAFVILSLFSSSLSRPTVSHWFTPSLITFMGMQFPGYFLSIIPSFSHVIRAIFRLNRRSMWINPKDTLQVTYQQMALPMTLHQQSLSSIVFVSSFPQSIRIDVFSDSHTSQFPIIWVLFQHIVH